MKSPVKLVVAGAGLVGKRHIEAIRKSEDAVLISIVDPDPAAKNIANQQNVPWYSSLQDMFAREQVDGIILATPNQVHVENGIQCLEAGCPMLIEKPLATSADEAEQFVSIARNKNIPILVGHHRRHNPLIQRAHEEIKQGRIGTLRAAHANCWLYKPDDYFEEAPWRKAKGAGPVSVNLIHDIDLLRYLCGKIVSVHSQATSSIRGYDNEDVAAAIFRFECGAIGTITVSDSIVSPWSYELTARENPVYPPTLESCYLLGGTHGSLSLPDLTVWEYSGERSWWQPISATTLLRDTSDPLVNQISHFAAVIRQEEQPLISGEEGLENLRVMEAMLKSANIGQPLTL